MVASLEAQFEAVRKKVRSVVKAAAVSMAYEISTFISQPVLNIGAGGSPVWTGQFIDSHQVSLNFITTARAADRPKEKRISPRASTSLTPEQVLTKVNNFKTGDRVVLSNATPYASKIEYQGTKTAPDGVYRVAVAKAQVTFATRIPSLIKGMR